MNKIRNKDINLFQNFRIKKYFYGALAIVFVMSVSATVTVGYGQSSRTASRIAASEPEEKKEIALIPSTYPTEEPSLKPKSSSIPTNSPSPSPSSSPENTNSDSSSNDSGSSEPQSTSNPTSTPNPQPTATPTPTPSSSPSPNPSPTPEPTPGQAPVIDIRYPSHNQQISIKSYELICLVEVPVDGNTNGLQRKYSYNGSSWTDYTDLQSLCLSPREGANTISLQYRNEHGVESAVYLRDFTVSF